VPRWPGHERPIRAAALRGRHGRATALPASALANNREQRIAEVEASLEIQGIEFLPTRRLYLPESLAAAAPKAGGGKNAQLPIGADKSCTRRTGVVG
jgi:hypothetical protein